MFFWKKKPAPAEPAPPPAPAAHYQHLTVKEVVRETPDTVSIHFWHPPHAAIAYKPGQFLTLLLTIAGRKVRRAYSMSSSPHHDASLAVTVKHLPGGAASAYLTTQVKPGDVLEVMEPMGNFVYEPDPALARQLVLIGAGSGITPLMSILKSVLLAEPRSRVVVLYGSRNENNIIFRQQLADLQQQYPDRLQVTHLLSQPNAWEGRRGRLSRSNLIELLEDHNVQVAEAEFYICGPTGLMDEAREAFNVLQVPAEHIHRENFVPTQATHGEVTETQAAGRPQPRTVTLLYEGAEYKVSVKPHETILEAALSQDVDLPYSCQAGMCTACMGKCTSGTVSMDEEDGLTPKEIAAGLVLTCVAHPQSDDVVIEI